MTIRHRVAGIAVAGWTLLGVMAWGQGAVKSTAKPPAPSEPVVATVGGRRITRATFDQRAREAEEGYRLHSSATLPAQLKSSMRRQVLEALIREQLLILEAKRRGMSLTAEQAEAELKKDPFFQRGGIFDEAKFLAIKNTQPEQFRSALETIQSQLPAIRLKQQLERENAPDPTRMKAEIERELSQVTIDFLALRRGSFSATHSEPSERALIEYYHAHASEYPRPEQFRLTLLAVNQPALPPADRDRPAAVQAWEAHMRERADSVLAAIKGRAKLEDFAAFGDLKTIDVERDHFPEEWRGNASTREALLSTSVGKMLGESVPGNNGFLLARVDERRPAHSASLREIAGTIRNRLRAELAARRDDQELGAIYATIKDSLRGPAHRIRYAVADTGSMPVPAPSAADLDRYYRGHLADYSFFDAKTSSVGAKPFSEVRDDVRRRLLQERRTSAARTNAEQLLAVWKAGKRDPKLERAMTLLREVGPVPKGGTVDTGEAGALLSDTLSARPGLRADWMRTPRGWVVYHVFAEVKDYIPSREEARPLLEARREPVRQQAEEAGARKLYEQDPARFGAANAVRFSRIMVNAPGPLSIPLTREEVEREYRANPESYGAPELVRVRHILVTPKDTSPRADAEARAEAEDVLRRLKAGELFTDLVRQYSDDEATRDKGGDVGVFRRGMMLDEFERVSFSMQAGDVGGPVKTEVGYHVIECLEHVPAEVTPLKYAYSTVAAQAALAKGVRIARFRADSLRRVLKNPAQARRVGEAMGFQIYQNDHVVGSVSGVSYLQDYFHRLEGLKPGQFDSECQEYRGMGYAVSWVDSIIPRRRPDWSEARNQAMDLYRREADRMALLRKRAEFDSLLETGWTFDSLAILFGGLERHGPHGPGSGLERLAGRELLDSLAFGTKTSAPVLAPGKVTGWVEFPAGFVMMRLAERRAADQVQVAARLENEGRAHLERNLRSVFDRLKKRYPVEIQDQELKLTELPPLPDS